MSKQLNLGNGDKISVKRKGVLRSSKVVSKGKHFFIDQTTVKFIIDSYFHGITREED